MYFDKLANYLRCQIGPKMDQPYHIILVGLLIRAICIKGKKKV